MPFIQTKPDNSISDITSSDEGGVEVNVSLLAPIKSNKFGFPVFDFINGSVVLNTDRDDANILAVEKIKFIDQIIDEDSKATARARQQGKITAIENASDMAALDALRNTP